MSVPTSEQCFLCMLGDFSKQLAKELSYQYRIDEWSSIIETRVLQFFNEMEKLKNAQR